MKIQQFNLSPKIVDQFAGGGGASTGIELALGRPVDVAINHDRLAISMHELNHPYTRHYQEDIFKVDPIEAVHGCPVDLLWASPDCTHFSKAKGGKPVRKKIRGLAWVVLKWASKVRPRVIMLENVPEFVTWGPIKKGQPVKERKGETFQQFVGHLRNLGYIVEWRELVASHYGAATSRKRLYLIARCDGEAITWPTPTYGKGLAPEHSAAEHIDFSIRGKSIFGRKKPLAEATQRRIVLGTDKFTIKSKKPFIIPVGYGEAPGQAPRTNDIDAPLGTVVSSVKHRIVTPHLVQVQFGNQPQDAAKPLTTVCGVNKHFISAPVLNPFVMTNTTHHTGQDAQSPLRTQTTGNHHYVVAPHISKYFSGKHQAGSDAGKPLDTITAIDHNALASSVLAPFIGARYGDNGGNNVRGKDIGEPLPTVTAQNDHNILTSPHLVQYNNEQPKDIASGRTRSYSLQEPLNTIPTNPRFGVSSAHLMQYYSNGQALDITKPMPTATTKDRMAVVKTYLLKYDRTADLMHWAGVRELLNKYAGYSMTDDEVLILEIDGVQYSIGDIEMRMLLPKELYGCQGFPADYIFDHITVDGIRKPLPIHEQVKKVGNSVCPPVAAALVRANCAWLISGQALKKPLTTMAAFYQAVAL
jgi:DNA (cytosine-5)-methyltransferase 1